MSLLRLYPGACNAELACNGLARDFDKGNPDNAVRYMDVGENACNEEEACMDCLAGMTSAELGTDDYGLTVSHAAQCPGGPFDYWGV